MMNLYRNRQFRWIFCLALSLVFSALFLPEARAWSGETWGPLSRGQIVERAEEMIGLFMTQFMPSDTFMARRDFRNMAYQALVD